MNNENEREQYRFEFGSLFEYFEDQKAYVHVYKVAGKSKREAIRDYENQLLIDEEEYMSRR